MELIDRFRYILKINQMNPSAFADEIGVQRSSVSHVLSGRNKPSMEFIQKVLQRFPKIDAAWLIAGSKDGQLPLEMLDNAAEEREEASIDSARKLPDQDQVNDVQSKKVVKVLVFYDDNTFEEFKHI